MKKYDKFPAKVYVDTFLKPDLHIYKTVFKGALFQINYAQCIMLREQKIISDEEAKIDPGSDPRLRDMISASCEILHHLIAWETILSFADLPSGPSAIATDSETSGAAPTNDPLATNSPAISVP